jgi:hypothetical protein
MITFGRYTLSYTPALSYHSESIEPTVNMEISAEANLQDMMNMFESFLQATGYILDGKRLILENPEEESPRFSSDQSFWFEDGVSMTGNPWSVTSKDFGENDQLILGSNLKGGLGEDHLSFNSNFSNNVVTFS